MLKPKSKKLDVITIGGATRDLMFYSGDGQLISTDNLTKQKLLAFEYGAKITADELYSNFGGGAANSAVSFANLGLKAGVICKVGQDDDGEKIIKNLAAKKVSTDLVKRDKENASAFSMILTVKGTAHEHIVFAYRGASDNLSAGDVNLAKVETKWLYVASLPKTGWEKIMALAVKKKTSVAWNPGIKQLEELTKLKSYLPKVKVLFLNRDEALEFKKLKDIKGLIKYIKGLGPEIVVITDSANGAYAYDGKTYYFMKALKRQSVDTVGVGDAFNSAFTSALIYGKNIRTALKWGITNSASVVTKIGAQNGLLAKRQIGR